MIISSPQRPRKLVVIAGASDQRDVGPEFLEVRVEERRQVHAAQLLFAPEQHGDRDRQPAGDRLPGAAGLDEGHQLAPGVGGAATRQHLRAVGTGDDLRAEGIVVPELERANRLHVEWP
jgi:hypothetical protein